MAVLVIFVFVAAIAVVYFGVADHLMYRFGLELTQRGAQSEASKSSDPANAEFDYAYSQLSEDDQMKYRILLKAFETREPQTYPETDTEDLTRIRECVLADHPELFYVRGAQITTTTNRTTGLTTGVVVKGSYLYTPEETQQMQDAIDTTVAECLAGLPASASDFDKARYVYEYVARNTEYDTGAIDLIEAGSTDTSNGQTIADVFIGKKAVCAGYAQACQYLLERLGIPCTYVTGTAKGQLHGWDLVQLDGAYYYMDPTWGDPQFLDETAAKVNRDWVNYEYFAITTDDLLTTHTLGSSFPVPTCTADADNYFVHEGLLFDSPDTERFGQLATDAAANGNGVVQIRCTNDQAFDELFAFVSSGGLQSYTTARSYWYFNTPALRTITVIL